VTAHPFVLRVLLLALTGFALWIALRPEGTDAPGLLRLQGGSPVPDAVLASGLPVAVLRHGGAGPSGAELEGLAAVAERAPLYVEIPESPPALLATPPARPRAGWASGVAYHVRGSAGDTLRVRLLDGSGVLDSALLTVGAHGWAEGAFRIRPPEPGWSEWTVSAPGIAARVGARVSRAEPPRVLLLTGSPGWESRFAARALEEAGAVVEVVSPLGRGLVAGTSAALPGLDRLGGFHAVLFLDGARPSTADAATLRRYVVDHGGGVLLAGGGDPAAEPRPVAARELRWSLPADLSALPPEPLQVAARPLGPAGPGAVEVLRSPDGPLLRLSTPGRGRVAELGLLESWAWRMEHGRVEEHRAFWSALVEWLGSGARETSDLRLPDVGTVGERLVGAAPLEPPGGLRLLHPGGTVEPLHGPAFVPARPGLYSMIRGSDTVSVRVDDGGEVPANGWARLAQLAYSSGGAALPRGELSALLADRYPHASPSPDRRSILPWLFAAIVMVAGAEWLIRRLQGSP
jgi:hypothetical protein